MDTSSWLVPAVVGATVPFFLALLTKRAAAVVVPATDGMVRLRLPRIYAVLGWAALVMAALFLAGAVLQFGQNAGMALFILLIGAGFGAMAIALLQGARNHRVTFNAERLQVTDQRGRGTDSAWSDVGGARFNTFSKMLVLDLKEGRRVKINPYLVGADMLFAAMRRHTALPVDDLLRQVRGTGRR